MIYTLTLNPSLDYVMTVGDIILGETNRSSSEIITFGGKGINVSLLLSRLGIANICLGFTGGTTGSMLEALLDKQSLTYDFLHHASGSTRINVKLQGAAHTEINAKGPLVGRYELESLFEKLGTLTSNDTLVLCGSANTVLGDNTYAEIMRNVVSSEVRVIVDASGQLLANTLPLSPYLIKPNLSELSQIAGRELHSRDDIICAARDLRGRGARNVLVSLGKNGAILACENGDIIEKPALGGTATNPVGAGDSMLAGFVAGIEAGESAERSLDIALACGGATACKMGIAEKHDVEILLGYSL